MECVWAGPWCHPVAWCTRRELKRLVQQSRFAEPVILIKGMIAVLYNICKVLNRSGAYALLMHAPGSAAESSAELSITRHRVALTLLYLHTHPHRHTHRDYSPVISYEIGCWQVNKQVQQP